MTTPSPCAFQRLDAYKLSKQLVVCVERLRISDRELRDQGTRACKSVFLNLSEGLPCWYNGIRKRHFELARCSAAETIAAVELSRDLGYVDYEAADAVLRLAYRVSAIIGGLLRKC